MTDARGSPALNWFGRALSRALTGLAMGAVVACLMVGIEHLAPGLEEASLDEGLRSRSVFVDPALTPTEAALGVRGYVFLDVDPGASGGLTEREGGDAACAALRRHDPASPAVDCQPLRSPNRHLLAALVRESLARGARLVVVDVVLGDDGRPLTPEENADLRAALDAAGLHAIYAPSYQTIPGGLPGEIHAIRPDIRAPLTTDPFGRQQGGTVSTSADAALRRYIPCSTWHAADGSRRPAPSLPYLAALRLRGEGAAVGCARWAGHQPPRILYTLQARRDHDNVAQPAEPARWDRQGLVLRRCLAEAFWDSEAPRCGDPSLYLGKVVVIGASSPQRGDRHLTPLGVMTGSEVVINATRSFLASPAPSDESWIHGLLDEAGLLLGTTLVWLGVWMVLERRRDAGWAGWSDVLVRAVFFLGGLAVVVGFTLAWSFRPSEHAPRLDVLIPLLSVGLEVFADLMNAVHHQVAPGLDRWLSRWGRLQAARPQESEDGS